MNHKFLISIEPKNERIQRKQNCIKNNDLKTNMKTGISGLERKVGRREESRGRRGGEWERKRERDWKLGWEGKCRICQENRNILESY